MRWSLLVLVFFLGCETPCDSSTCPGCCASATECLTGISRLGCGIGGEACVRCSSQEQCVTRRCEPIPVVDAGFMAPGCQCLTACCLPDGSCAPNNGIEACGPAKTYCGTCFADQRCERGSCVAGACAGCLDPLGVCQAGTANGSCGADGGVCLACGTDQACQQGRCAFIRCDVGNCRFGCCQPDLVCTTSSVAACGLGGDPCAVCTGTQQCLGGICQ